MFAFSRHDFFFVDIHITNIYVTNRLRSAWLPVDNQVIYDFHQRNIDKYTIHMFSFTQEIHESRIVFRKKVALMDLFLTTQGSKTIARNL